jgi:hypothetical protein
MLRMTLPQATYGLSLALHSGIWSELTLASEIRLPLDLHSRADHL